MQIKYIYKKKMKKPPGISARGLAGSGERLSHFRPKGDHLHIRPKGDHSH
jgi:hypothetical protein